YILAVSDAAGALPLLVPALGERIAVGELIARLDGLLLTGSRSNVEPHHYEGEPSEPGTLHDAPRDALTLPLIRAAIGAGLPVLAICRGIQELNVALGGTLHQRVHEVAGRLDHRAPEGDVERRYGHGAHAVALTPGGMLERLAGARELVVNSLHSQGIDRLAPALVVEAAAPDGQIEAVRHKDAAFVVGVQWHPEFRAMENAFSRALFAAFGEACRARARRRTPGCAA
ncbi:MAG TPA: gamma-glutamyl-gamma-aminobutyrate hydrolase family protein, partial [Stellaceae bacterium]